MKADLTSATCQSATLVALISTAVLLAAAPASRADIIYVSNHGSDTIRKFDSATGADLGNFAISGLGWPEGLAFDNAGNLYVANSYYYTIEKFTPGGAGSVFASTGLSMPWGLAFDSAGNLYAANSGNTIEKFSPSGVDLGVFASLDSSLVGLAFDSAGNLYGVNSWDTTIERFTPDGVGSVFASTGMNGPTFIAIQVPEPSNLALLTLALSSLLSLRRRKA